MNHKIVNQKGFTLLELMVVVAIIGILSAVGVVAFTTIQRSGRDARRIQDMKAYQNAQEQYFTQNDNEYASGTNCSVAGIMPQEVEDPKAGSFYDCDGQDYGYCACADLEDDTKGNATSCSCGGTSCTITAGTTHFCVSNLQ